MIIIMIFLGIFIAYGLRNKLLIHIALPIMAICVNIDNYYHNRTIIVEDKKIKKWQKPELIILIRNQPEENVLGTCKNEAGSGPDAAKCLKQGYNDHCNSPKVS
jgi:hypothetical protein